MQETWVQSLGLEDPLEKGKATHSSTLAWRVPWTVWSMGSQRVRRDWATLLHFEEISPESRLDWSLLVSSSIASLKPAKTHTLGFPWSPLSPLDRKSSVVQTSSQISRGTHRQTASLRSQVELREHSRNQCSQSLGSASPSFSSQWLCPDGSRMVTNHPRPTSCTSHCCRLTSLAPALPAARELLFPLIPVWVLALGPDWSLPQSWAHHGGQGGWNTPIGQIQVMWPYSPGHLWALHHISGVKTMWCLKSRPESPVTVSMCSVSWDLPAPLSTLLCPMKTKYSWHTSSLSKPCFTYPHSKEQGLLFEDMFGDPLLVSRFVFCVSY